MEKLSRRAVIGAFAALMATVPRAGRAAEPAGEKGQRVALQGYDPVSYFTVGHPEKGSRDVTASYDDATYWFKNAEHRALFVADPDRYAPQFSAYCAMSLSRGEKVEPDPESFVIADGKLYMFGKKNGPALFAEQGTGVVEKAAQNWRELRKHP